MEEILKQILSKLDSLEQGQQDLQQGQNKLDAKVENLGVNLNDKIDAMDKRINTRIDSLEKTIDTVYNMVGDLVEFKGETETKLKKIK